jgi:hypothetical protein
VQVLLAGDSIAETLAWGLDNGDQPWHVKVNSSSLTTLIGCGVTQATPIDYGGLLGPTESYCQDWQESYRKAVEQVDPAISMLLAGRWEIADAMYQGKMRNILDPVYASYVEAQLTNAIDILSNGGKAKVVLLTAPYSAWKTEPAQPLGLPSCSPGCNRHFPEDDPARVDAYNAILREIAASDPGEVTVVDLNAEVDPGGEFTPCVQPSGHAVSCSAPGSIPLRNSDGIHFFVPSSAAGAPPLWGGEWLRPWLLPKLYALAGKHAAT